MSETNIDSARRLFDAPVREINHRVTAGRADYLAGQHNPDSIRPIIAESWNRTRSIGIDPESLRAPSVISLEKIDEILRTQELGITGRRVLDRFAGLVEGSKHVIVLADERGRILYEVGHQGVYDSLESINFVPGGHWSEQAVGPNGIGTPLNLGRPELVLGSEHYCAGWQPWVCYGAPVFDPDSGRPVGAIDITGPSGAADLQTLALTVSIAQSVEQQLELAVLQNRDLLRTRFREIERRWPGDALVLLSDAGRILDINRIAARNLGFEHMVHMEQPLADVLPDLWLSVRDLVQTGKFGERRAEVLVINERVRELHCRVEPIHENGRKVGTVLVVSGFHRLTSREVAQKPTTRSHRLSDIIGSSPAIQHARQLALLAASDCGQPVLLLGETGTGKEMFAQGIHAASDRCNKPFVALNCGALPRDLAESELFGYAAGAFTGAKPKGHPGKFETADGGTLFLDEIDSLDESVQAKLLRVLEDFMVYRVGENLPRAVDVRIIAAGDVSLTQAVDENRFRRDLYHRLNVVDIRLPALRQRREDVGALLRHFVSYECQQRGSTEPQIEAPVFDYLSARDWPGNVRELQNFCRRLLLTTRGHLITLADVELQFGSNERLVAANRPEKASAAATTSLRSISDEAIRDAVQACDGNIAEAARRLGINRTTIYRRKLHQE